MFVQNHHQVFIIRLQEIYYIENLLVDAYKQLANNTINKNLREAFLEHRKQTRKHVSLLTGVFEMIDEDPKERTSLVFDSLVEEWEYFLRQENKNEMRNQYELNIPPWKISTALDLYNRGTALRIEHLEIATYENLLVLARKLKIPRKIRDFLRLNLSEDRRALREFKALGYNSIFRQLLARILR